MNLHIVTIALDAMPQMRWHLPVLNRLTIPWTWHIAEGVAAPIADTAWCTQIPGRFSRDGTAEYLNSLTGHPRIKIYRKQLWNGKTEMFNTMLSNINGPCVLLQMDSDELWTERQLETLVRLFSDTNRNCADFYCRYFVGQNIIITSHNTYGNKAVEWRRAFIFQPGMQFKTHEPPVMAAFDPKPFTREETRDLGLVFDHYAYCFESQVAFKEQYYGYQNAVAHWRKLQQNKTWPALVKQFLPWVKDNAVADLLYNP